jgi:FlaA1/EpsC-like NDP-sugar epimerase
MPLQIRNYRLYIKLLIDATSFALAFFAAYLLRFEFALTERHFNEIRLVICWLIPLKLAIFGSFGLYRRMWRYTSLHDLWFLALANALSTLVTVDMVLYFFPFHGFSRAVFLLDAIITFVVTGGFRILIRSYNRFNSGSMRFPSFRLRGQCIKTSDPKSVLIIGAGSSGEKILREILDNSAMGYKVVGFLDDNPAKTGMSLHGVPVFGSVDLLPCISDRRRVDQVIISTPSASGPEMRRIVEICKSCGMSFKTLPGIGQLLDNKVSIKALRDVNYEDLLGRPPVHLDTTSIQNYLTRKRIMVTGAGGSIGSELCRQLIRFEPEEIVLVDAGEANLYNIQMELRHELNFQDFQAVLAGVQNEGLMEDVFRNYRPDVVFHAAAYKHVPLLERNPWQAVMNNVLGSSVVMHLAAKYETGRFVLVSTDKAVRPTSVMGTSKRLAELILQSMQNGPTSFIAVRFGNVLASCGSVIPLFRKQIEYGGPVTVTHPEITRYFMTIQEATQLIMQAGAMGNGGEIFVLEMGTPVKIADMASDLIRLSGKEPGRDIEVVFTGLRPGEKLHEELITEGEDVIHTSHEKIVTLGYNGHWNWGGFSSQHKFRNWLDKGLQDLYRTSATRDPIAIREKLKQLIPEYTPEETDCVLSGGNGNKGPVDCNQEFDTSLRTGAQAAKTPDVMDEAALGLSSGHNGSNTH